MSFQSAIPWRVALRQSLPPLYRPVTILNNPLTNNNSKTKSNNKTKTKNKIKVVYTEDLTHPMMSPLDGISAGSAGGFWYQSSF